MRVEPALAAWVEHELGSPVAEEFFTASSMSRVHGVELEDGRRVALKVRGGGDHVQAGARAHLAAQTAGIDVANLLGGPSPLPHSESLWVTAEQWRDDGALEPMDDAREHFAALLARLVVALRDVDPTGLRPPPWMRYDHDDPSRVWPQAESDRWDPHRLDGEVPEALVATARAARERLRASALPEVVGHSDLNALNVRWNVRDSVPVPVVHDWDSVAARPEAVLVGIVATDHVAGPGVERITTVDDTAETIAAYQRASGRSFSQDELDVAWAASAWIACYNSVFEYLHGAPGAVSEQILADAPERLRLAGAAP